MSNTLNQSTWPTPDDGLAYLELQTYAEKVQRWGGPQPLKIAKHNVRTIKPDLIVPGDVKLVDGNIISMPTLIGRPCFGIPTAWLRHGGSKMRYVLIRKAHKETRCMLCAAREACTAVACARIKLCEAAHPRIEKWVAAGGRDKMFIQQPQHPVNHQWRSITKELQTVSFTSSNDDVVRDHYEAKREEAQRKDRERKRRGRAKAIAAGDVDQAFLQQLKREGIYRSERLRQVRSFKGVHPSLRKLDDRGARLTSDVWRHETLLSLGGREATPYGIAKNMIAEGCNHGLELDSLRARIPTDLRRARKLERSPWPGGSDPIWPVFDVAIDLQPIDLG